MAQWVFRPSDEEEERMIARMKGVGYPTRAAFMREAVLRMLNDHDLRPMFTQVEDLIESLQDSKDRFLKTLLFHTEE